MINGILKDIAVSIGNLENSEKIKELVNEALSQGIAAVDIIEKGLRIGLEQVGKRYEAGEYFLSELMFAGKLMNDAMEILEPHLKLEKLEAKGIIVLGTVRGDIHDIGKNIFKMLAQASGFDVIDLGVDVAPEVFIEKLKETNAKILGLSALLTTTMLEMKTVIDMLNQAGIRSKVKVLVGGSAITKDFAKEISADEAASDAVDGVEICKRWVKGV
ncbi:MAG: corrinoid protein [Candidatus Bathyarchaeia archaeon]